MHPALSIIFFTTASGAGFGLFAVLSTLVLLGRLPHQLFILASVAGAILVVLGLFSSTLHLANPKNAWRAFSRFKTSWLAREAVLAVIFFPVMAIWVAWSWLGATSLENPLWVFLSSIVLVLALATIFSTAMIYACLKTIPQWHTALTPVNYILLGLMTGQLLILALLESKSLLALSLALLLIALAAIAKLVYYVWIGAPQGHSISTATGFTRGTVRLLDVGHTAGTFLTDEFGYRLSARASLLLRILVFVFAFMVPALLILGYLTQVIIGVPLWIGFISAFVGVLIERWLFFAEARHVVNLYHGAQQV